ncbi:MAG TPA: ABC transporter ATP-binding protein [Blastocatellia bacterium]|nr:ABC transporter ATP-binding protein [Blastocatellia bacterium]
MESVTVQKKESPGLNRRTRNVIQLEGIEKVYRTAKIETVALTNVNITVTKGEFISIMGPSGSGKSTLLNVIGLLDVPTGGKVFLGGKQITSYSDRALARVRNEEVGFIFQTFHLISDLSVLDNVEIPLLYRTMSNSERKKLALKALDRVGLASRVHHFPSQLSGGQQQRVAIARAIVGNPRILLADEPTGNLDSQMGDEIMEILMSLSRDEETTVVMVTHDPRQAGKTERIVRLFDGRQVN